MQAGDSRPAVFYSSLKLFLTDYNEIIKINDFIFNKYFLIIFAKENRKIVCAHFHCPICIDAITTIQNT